VAPIAQSGLIDLFRAGLTQLLAKIAPTSPPPSSPTPDNGAGVRIDPEGHQASPSPTPVGNP
jgi:hypothetical protein